MITPDEGMQFNYYYLLQITGKQLGYLSKIHLHTTRNMYGVWTMENSITAVYLLTIFAYNISVLYIIVNIIIITYIILS